MKKLFLLIALLPALAFAATINITGSVWNGGSPAPISGGVSLRLLQDGVAPTGAEPIIQKEILPGGAVSFTLESAAAGYYYQADIFVVMPGFGKYTWSETWAVRATPADQSVSSVQVGNRYPGPELKYTPNSGDLTGGTVTATGSVVTQTLAEWAATGPVAASNTLVTATGSPTARTAAEWAAHGPVEASGTLVTPANSATSEALTSLAKKVNEASHWGILRTVPRKVHAKLWTNGYNKTVANGLKTQIRLMTFGDSLSGYKPPFVIDALFGALGQSIPRIGGSWLAGGYETQPVQATSVGVSGTYVTDATGTFNANAGDGFTYWPMFPLSRVLNTTRAKFLVGGVNPIFTNCVIYYVKEPGAGTMQVLVDDVAVTTIDANAALGLGRYEITQALASKKVELLGTGGTIRVIGAFPTNTTVITVEQWAAGYSGILLSDSIASATCRTLFQAWVTDVAPDMFMLELADAVTGWEAALNQLGVMLDAAIPNGDKVFSASPPSSGDDYIAQRDIVEKVCRERGYIFFDGNAPLQPHSALVALGWNGDNVHPADAAKAFSGMLLVRQLGLDHFSGRALTNPLACSRLPSVLGSGTSVRIDDYADKELIFKSTGQGHDWTEQAYRSINFSVGSPEVVVARFGDPGQGFYSFLPDGVYIRSTAYGRLLADNGSPEGSKSGLMGSLYLNLAGGDANALWIKTSGSGFAGWRQATTHIRATGTLATAAIGAGTTATQNITVTGAVVGAEVAVGGPATLEAGLILYAYVSATNTVTLRVSNVSAGSITPAAAQTVSVRVFNP